MIETYEELRRNTQELLKSTEIHGTPQYIFLEKKFKDRIKKIRTVFKDNYDKTEIYFAYKSCPVPHICNIANNEGLGAEVGSLLELQLALKIGAKNVIINGPCKTREEIELAIKNSTIIIVDNISELKKISSLSKKLNVKATVGIRVNIFPKTSLTSNFGVSFNDLKNIMSKDPDTISVQGIHFHAGYAITNPKSYISALKKIRAFLLRIKKENLKKIQFIDIGGGFGVEGLKKKSLLERYCNYKNKKYFFEKVQQSRPRISSIETFSKEICEYVKKRINTIEGVQKIVLKLEVGSWLINPCMRLLSKVQVIKKDCVIVDAGKNALPLSTTQNFSVYNISNISEKKNQQTIRGNLCLSDDILAKSFYGKKIKEQDILCFTNTGAYNISFSMPFLTPLPQIISYNGKNVRVIRTTEDFDYRYGRDIY